MELILEGACLNCCTLNSHFRYDPQSGEWQCSRCRVPLAVDIVQEAITKYAHEQPKVLEDDICSGCGTDEFSVTIESIRRCSNCRQIKE